MSYRNGFSKSLALTMAVFAGGAGLGFSWRQGWLPIEFLPPPTGVLDEAESVQTPRDVTPLQPVSPLASLEMTNDIPVPADQSEPSATEIATVSVPAEESPPVERGVQQTVFQETPKPKAPVTKPATPPARASSDFDTLLAQADALLNDGDTLAAHKLLSKLYWNDRARRPEIQERLDETARIVFFDPQRHFIDPYVIQPGDRLESIAAEHRLSWEYLAALNRTDPRRIQAGKRLKVVRGPFAAVVELDDFSLTIHLQGYYVRRYPVGIGRDGSSPIGKFPVLNKVVNPAYTDPDGRVIDGDDPQNPLGERWIDLGNSYGIHGTIEPQSIGRAASRGCIRLQDDDIVAVYNFLVNGSDVVIRK
ncbi:MAG TPA: L,D-transpeptidase family protein [Planctomycetaceae bacterium]|nr:L,D-transpeptidase family protein [Planctomycetaceae bacterium]